MQPTRLGGPILIRQVCFSHPAFAGVHFTGSTGVFQDMWKTIGQNIHLYATYPRIVGETGGKDFILAHPSAKVPALVTAISRGAFEYQGQKCSAASRGYVPANLWDEVKAGYAARCVVLIHWPLFCGLYSLFFTGNYLYCVFIFRCSYIYFSLITQPAG